jgi:hypothetical protein
MATNGRTELETQEFNDFLFKLRERLTIILVDNPSKSVDPIPSDIKLLEELYLLYDKSELDFANIEKIEGKSVSQTEMFPDK